MTKAAVFDDVLRAVFEDRLRVDLLTGAVMTRRGDLKATWRQAKVELVKGPHQVLPYERVRFATSEGQRRCLVHRLVWFVARGPIPDGLEINHGDGNKRHNAIGNLELTTGGGNMKHAEAHGLIVHGRGERMASRAALTDEQVRAIRADVGPQAGLGERFGIAQSQVSRVRSRRSYAWVE
jgi:hypothetical protein